MFCLKKKGEDQFLCQFGDVFSWETAEDALTRSPGIITRVTIPDLNEFISKNAVLCRDTQTYKIEVTKKRGTRPTFVLRLRPIAQR